MGRKKKTHKPPIKWYTLKDAEKDNKQLRLLLLELLEATRQTANQSEHWKNAYLFLYPPEEPT